MSLTYDGQCRVTYQWNVTRTETGKYAVQPVINGITLPKRILDDAEQVDIFIKYEQEMCRIAQDQVIRDVMDRLNR